MAAVAPGGRQEKVNPGGRLQRGSPYPVKLQAPRPLLSETYDPKELKMRPNPLLPRKPAQWSYKFPEGKIIYLSSPCSKCGAKHFNFECKKEHRGTVARAAFMTTESAWDESSLQQSYEDYTYASDTVDYGQRQITSEPWCEMLQKKEN
jgi:hypothetical protein